MTRPPVMMELIALISMLPTPGLAWEDVRNSTSDFETCYRKLPLGHHHGRIHVLRLSRFQTRFRSSLMPARPWIGSILPPDAPGSAYLSGKPQPFATLANR